MSASSVSVTVFTNPIHPHSSQAIVNTQRPLIQCDQDKWCLIKSWEAGVGGKEERRAEAFGVIDRYLLVANIQCVLGMSQDTFHYSGEVAKWKAATKVSPMAVGDCLTHWTVNPQKPTLCLFFFVF